MTDFPMRNATAPRRMIGLVLGCISWMGAAARVFAPLTARLALGVPFFKSGLTRWDGWFQLSDSTVFLFQEMFKLHIFGSEYGLPMPGITAFIVGVAEITLPVFLILGLGTRLAALALLVMTGVIQLIVPEGWANFHLPWAALALSIIAMGPGSISVDNFVKKFFAGKV